MSLSVDSARFTVDAGRVFASATVRWATGLRPDTAPSGGRSITAPNPPTQIGGSS